MSDQVPVRFLQAYGPYGRGDMATVAADEIQRLLAVGVVALLTRETSVETTMATPAAERAVTRTRKAG